ncbi:SDR family NAD(P)-dependent oxidoreductase [Sphingobium algorifonticola]|uniref:SDR family oxidoreductase n=1 Tax=Sphingobium algorifonticola TaxID=2008318 RepID=A0A437J3N8_9SPHN|nr:SDR family NAD(P)-dependent oxidoreductase [Sphingobium algorifonticola]RVT39147.1 SDR family oxidoreductase [Sphingobium algorifonticola]
MTGFADRLRGKVAIITGSGGSIGRAACLRFAAEGAAVVGCDLQSDAAAATVKAVEEIGGIIDSLHPCDLTEPDDAQALVDLALARFGRIDVLYNNAAMAHFAWFDAMDHDLFSRTIRDELEILFHLTKCVWPHFVAQRSGAIVNTASVSASICYAVVPGLAHSTAKAGVLGMTRHLAMEGAPHGIRVNSVSPGLVRTNQSEALLADVTWAGAMLSKIMLDRFGTPDDVAAAAAFLASDDAAWITGTDLAVDGGTMAW